MNLNGSNKSRLARVIIDTGSQRTYISQSAVHEMVYDAVRREQMIHALFGGTNTKAVDHFCYPVRLSTLHIAYACNF